MRFSILAENEPKFKAIVDAWRAKATGSEWTAFWKACPKRKDTLINTTPLVFPAIKNSNSPVAVVPVIEEKPDPSIDYKIVIDFTAFSTLGETEKLDSSKVNWGLSEVGRIFNFAYSSRHPKRQNTYCAGRTCTSC